MIKSSPQKITADGTNWRFRRGAEDVNREVWNWH